MTNSNLDHFGTFERSLATCIDAMFDGETIRRLPSAPPVEDDDVVLASIGFACEGARGSLLLLGMAKAPNPTALLTVEGRSEPVDCDVVGELANMLVGRLKNDLLDRGIVLLLGTPLTTIARVARVLASNEPTTSAWFDIQLPAGRLCARLDTCFDDAFKPQPIAQPSRSVGREGDMLFF